MLNVEYSRPTGQLPSVSFAPQLTGDTVLFRLWAPFNDRIFLRLDGAEPVEMNNADEGWHQCEVRGAGPGSLYAFMGSDGLEFPDPASRFQPQDVHGASEVIDLDGYQWRTEAWIGRPWAEMIIYEVHIGSFTSEGTFKSAIERLEHLKELGVTAIQLMPLSDFPGRYNWGYDGVLPYAPDSSYGRPEDLMALIDAAHELGISVFLDVVYNHFGPDGNYMSNYAPLFTDKHQSDWGQGINYDGEGSQWVREFVIQNALYWIAHFRFDGLRLDAVHAIVDDSDEHVVHELARRVREFTEDRHIHLIVENEDNDSDLLRRGADGVWPLYTAQWNDDLHHVLHVAATGENFGYYADYSEHSSKLARSLTEGFVFQGEHMSYSGKPRGKPSVELHPTSFISFIQNHDQIGNRAHGERMITYRGVSELKAIAAVFMLAPAIPMLFMGEEWGAPEPFPYFCDFDDELNRKVQEGRRSELSRLPGYDSNDLPDPAAQSTFASAKLDWSRLRTQPNAEMLEYYRTLLKVRTRHIVPLLSALDGHMSAVRADHDAVAVDWTFGRGRSLHLICNLSKNTVDAGVEHVQAEPVFSLGSLDGTTLAPWTVIWSAKSS